MWGGRDEQIAIAPTPTAATRARADQLRNWEDLLQSEKPVWDPSTSRYTCVAGAYSGKDITKAEQGWEARDWLAKTGAKRKVAVQLLADGGQRPRDQPAGPTQVGWLWPDLTPGQVSSRKRPGREVEKERAKLQRLQRRKDPSTSVIGGQLMSEECLSSVKARAEAWRARNPATTLTMERAIPMCCEVLRGAKSESLSVRAKALLVAASAGITDGTDGKGWVLLGRAYLARLQQHIETPASLQRQLRKAEERAKLLRAKLVRAGS
eukprot:COSAG02_NODE_802_length_17030_cov_37.485500_3_plen_265_part_00